MIGQTLGGYEIVREIGSGGMGTVYLAKHTRIHRRAAVKVLLPECSARPEFVDRFFAEARAASVINHPGIIEIFDCDVHSDGCAFIVMEYLEGESLRKCLDRLGTFAGDPAALIAIGQQIANAMGAAHERGIIHRDLKPDNVYLVSGAALGLPFIVKVLDFGIAKLLDRELGPATQTRAGTLMGTPAYMSPEQCRGNPDVGAPSDVYALGCILFEMACGRAPFVKESLAELLAAHLSVPAPRASSLQPSIPEALDALIATMLAKDPSARPQSMFEVEEAIGAIGNALPSPIPALQIVSAEGSSIRSMRPISRVSTGGGRRSMPPPPLEATVRPERPSSARPFEVKAIIAAALALAVIGTGGVLLWSRLHPVRVETAQTSSQHVEAVPPPPPPPKAPTPPQGMVYLSGGTFTLGSTEDEIAAVQRFCQEHGIACRPDLLARETPAHAVTLDAFFLDATEVANDNLAAWLARQPVRIEKERFVRDEAGSLLLDLHPAHSGLKAVGTSISVRASHSRRPVVQITWIGAHRYCADQGKRLPTEAEWEWAARGATRRMFPWGDALPRCEQVVFARAQGAGCASQVPGADDVGSAPFDATPEGVRDLGGNVAEWVADEFEAPYPSCGPDCRNPSVNGTTEHRPVVRTIRGGDWAGAVDACRAAGRSRREQDKPQANVGFRCAKSLP